MERDIAVYSYDGELLQWIDLKRFRRLSECDRLARVVKARSGRIKRVTLRHMPGEWKPSLLSDYQGTKVLLSSVPRRWTSVLPVARAGRRPQ